MLSVPLLCIYKVIPTPGCDLILGDHAPSGRIRIDKVTFFIKKQTNSHVLSCRKKHHWV